MFTEKSERIEACSLYSSWIFIIQILSILCKIGHTAFLNAPTLQRKEFLGSCCERKNSRNDGLLKLQSFEVNQMLDVLEEDLP